MTGSISAKERSSPKKICWLTSYPKSGNTWTRILLSNLLNEKRDVERDHSIIDLAGSISSDRVIFDNLTGISSSDMTDDEIDLLRANTYRQLASDADQLIYPKVHDAYHACRNGIPIFPTDCSLGAIYLVRNPLDVAISYAHHKGSKNFTEVVKQMNRPDHVISGGPKSQLRQKTMGWTGHYRSWHDQTSIPLLTVRYEDMLADTVGCLKKMAEFIGFKNEQLPERVEWAVKQSQFKKLQETEKRVGFRERPDKASRFFRSGRSGEGAEQLSSDLQQQLLDYNGPLMQELGYI